jgi:hypothetical protein
MLGGLFPNQIYYYCIHSFYIWGGKKMEVPPGFRGRHGLKIRHIVRSFALKPLTLSGRCFAIRPR